MGRGAVQIMAEYAGRASSSGPDSGGRPAASATKLDVSDDPSPREGPNG